MASNKYRQPTSKNNKYIAPSKSSYKPQKPVQKPAQYKPPSLGSSKMSANRAPSRHSKPMTAVPSMASRGKAGPIAQSNIKGKGSTAPVSKMPEKAKQPAPKKEEKKKNGLLGNLVQGISNFGSGVKDKVTSAVGSVLEKGKEGAKSLIGSGTKAFEGTKAFLGNVLEKGKEGAKNLVNKGAKAVEGTKELLGSVLEKGKEGAKSLISKGAKVAEGTKEVFGSILEKGKEGAKSLIGKGAKIAEGAKEVFGSVLEKGKEGAKWLKEKGTNAAEGAKEFFGNILAKGKEGVNWLKEKGSNALEGTKEFLGNAVQKGKDGFNWLKEKGAKAAEGAKELFGNAFGKLKGAVTGTWQDFKGTAKETFGNVIGAAKGTWDEVVDAWDANWGEKSKNRDPNAKERTGFDKFFDFGGKLLGSGVKLTERVKTELVAGGTKFASQGAGRVADMVSTEAGDKIREAGSFASNLVRTVGNERANIMGDVIHGAIAGDSIENPNASQIAGQVIMGFIPIAGQIADARDVIGGAVAKDPIRFTTSLVGFIPGLGDGLKQLKHADEAVGVMKHLGKFTDLMKNSKIVKAGSELVGKMKGSKIVKGIGEVVGQLKNSKVVKGAGELVGNAIGKGKEVVEGIAKKGSKIVEGGKEFLGNALEKGSKGVKELFGKGTKLVEGGKEFLGNALKDGAKGVKKLFGKGAKVAEGAKEFIGNMVKKAPDSLKALLDKGGKIAEGVKELVGGALKKGSDKLVDGAKWLGGKGKGAAEWLGKKASGVEEWLGKKVDGTKDWLGKKVDGVKDWFSSKFGKNTSKEAAENGGKISDDIATVVRPDTETIKNIEKAISESGISEEKFLELMRKSSSELTPDEAKIFERIRNTVTMPDANTQMQKVLNPNHVSGYLDGSFAKFNEGRIGGCLTTVDDASRLSNPQAIYEGLRLDYAGTPFSPDDVYNTVIRFTSNDAGNIKVPFGNGMPNQSGGKIADMTAPFTGNGFTSATNGQIIPEFYSEGMIMSNGAQMIEITSEGKEIIKAIFDEDLMKFIPVN